MRNSYLSIFLALPHNVTGERNGELQQDHCGRGGGVVHDNQIWSLDGGHNLWRNSSTIYIGPFNVSIDDDISNLVVFHHLVELDKDPIVPPFVPIKHNWAVVQDVLQGTFGPDVGLAVLQRFQAESTTSTSPGCLQLQG